MERALSPGKSILLSEVGCVNGLAVTESGRQFAVADVYPALSYAFRLDTMAYMNAGTPRPIAFSREKIPKDGAWLYA